MDITQARYIGERTLQALSALEKAGMIPRPFLATPPFRFDFSEENREVAALDTTRHGVLQGYISRVLKEAGRTWGLGGYGEQRNWYRSELFEGNGGQRTVHLGIDVWLPAGTPIYLPLEGQIHSFQNNQAFLDYGPTIIMEHVISGVHFFTLYGHLSTDSLSGLSAGKVLKKEEEIGKIGKESENGSWAPHLHFQIIGDMLGKVGDFPAVAKCSEKDFYLALCPNPELLFRLS